MFVRCMRWLELRIHAVPRSHLTIEVPFWAAPLTTPVRATLVCLRRLLSPTACRVTYSAAPDSRYIYRDIQRVLSHSSGVVLVLWSIWSFFRQRSCEGRHCSCLCLRSRADRGQFRRVPVLLGLPSCVGLQFLLSAPSFFCGRACLRPNSAVSLVAEGVLLLSVSVGRPLSRCSTLLRVLWSPAGSFVPAGCTPWARFLLFAARGSGRSRCFRSPFPRNFPTPLRDRFPEVVKSSIFGVNLHPVRCPDPSSSELLPFGRLCHCGLSCVPRVLYPAPRHLGVFRSCAAVKDLVRLVFAVRRFYPARLVSCHLHGQFRGFFQLALDPRLPRFWAIRLGPGSRSPALGLSPTMLLLSSVLPLFYSSVAVSMVPAVSDSNSNSCGGFGGGCHLACLHPISIPRSSLCLCRRVHCFFNADPDQCVPCWFWHGSRVCLPGPRQPRHSNLGGATFS